MAETLDVAMYLRPPVVDVPTAIALAQALLSAQPKDAPAEVRKAGKALERALTILKTAWSAREVALRSEDRRSYDQALDAAWARLHDRLYAYSTLPAVRHPKAPRASELYDELFADGLSFLKLPYEAEWAESQRRIEHIKAAGFERELTTLCGAEFLAEVEYCHKEYGAVLGITKAAPAAAPPMNLLELLRQLMAAMSRYTLKLVASVDDEDAASVEAVRTALRPYDDFRSAASRRDGQKGEPASPASPAPGPDLSPPPATPPPSPR